MKNIIVKVGRDRGKPKTTNIPAQHNTQSVIVAVDFDGVLSLAGYPEEGSPNRALIIEINRRKRMGDRFILWTCREGDDLNRAVAFCSRNGLMFDAVNENLPDIQRERGDCRKVYANEYWDDKAVRIMNSDF